MRAGAPPVVVAIVLAAGAGARLGGRSKAELDFDGVSALDLVHRACTEGGCAGVLIVYGAHLPEEAPSRDPYTAWIWNRDWAQGQTRSLQEGLVMAAHAWEAATYFLVFPVDYPLVDHTVVSTLLLEAGQQTAQRYVPTFEGKRGHPYLISREVLPLIAALDPSASVREVYRSPEVRSVEVPVESRWVLEDVDTPEDLERMRSKR